MDISVRGIDPVAVKKLDELAKRKKVSRSEYIRQMIEAVAVLDAVNDAGDKYERLVQAVVQALTASTETLEQVRMLLENGGGHDVQ